MNCELTFAALPLTCCLLGSVSLSGQESAESIHSRREFTFTVNAALEKTAPLFGAYEERKWAPGWDPQFVYPSPPKDQQGSVFRVEHGSNTSVWTTAAFDLAAGHFQYVCVMNNAMVTLIDIHLTARAAETTEVSVVYERTALTSDGGHLVVHFAKQDEHAGTEWAQQINGYLKNGN